MGISKRMGDVLGQAVEAKLLKEVHEHPVKVTHLAIIMDGNRRFAWKSKLAAGLGHRIGKQKLETVLDWVLELEKRAIANVLRVFALRNTGLRAVSYTHLTLPTKA